MKGTIYLILGLFFIAEVVYHLVEYNGQPGRIFGFEIPNIPYMLINAIAGIYLLFCYYKERKERLSK